MEGLVFWFTGLSGAGKSTIAERVREKLQSSGQRVRIIDGDDIRRTTSNDLGFGRDEILENNVRIEQICADARKSFQIVLVPVISPYRMGRAAASEKLGDGFFEIYVRASIDCVARRDVKGLYAKAKQGEIKNMIGLSPDAPYEAPETPELIVDTEADNADESTSRLVEFIEAQLGDQ